MTYYYRTRKYLERIIVEVCAVQDFPESEFIMSTSVEQETDSMIAIIKDRLNLPEDCQLTKVDYAEPIQQ